MEWIGILTHPPHQGEAIAANIRHDFIRGNLTQQISLHSVTKGYIRQ